MGCVRCGLGDQLQLHGGRGGADKPDHDPPLLTSLNPHDNREPIGNFVVTTRFQSHQPSAPLSSLAVNPNLAPSPPLAAQHTTARSARSALAASSAKRHSTTNSFTYPFGPPPPIIYFTTSRVKEYGTVFYFEGAWLC